MCAEVEIKDHIPGQDLLKWITIKPINWLQIAQRQIYF